jgi:hypothetical protein
VEPPKARVKQWAGVPNCSSRAVKKDQEERSRPLPTIFAITLFYNQDHGPFPDYTTDHLSLRPRSSDPRIRNVRRV